MAELLLSSASSWINGGRAVTLAMPTPLPSSCAAAPLEVALPFGPSLRVGGGVAPVPYMGGGPRTYPGGVTKWQWRRMQLKKSRQIEKARLLREKHIYEARRRAELLAASPVLEMPWQKMSRVRPPNYVTADEQVTKLAARFERRGAEDLWTEKDGPESFEVLNNESLTQYSTTMARNQDTSQWNFQNAAQQDGQWNSPSRVQDAGPSSSYQSFRHRPPLRHGSTSHSEPSYKGYQDTSQLNFENVAQPDGQWNSPNRAQGAPSSYYQPFRHRPPLSHGSTSHSEHSYKGVSRRPQPQDERWNREQDARPSYDSHYIPRIRPGPTSHPEPFYKERSRRPHG